MSREGRNEATSQAADGSNGGQEIAGREKEGMKREGEGWKGEGLRKGRGDLDE